MSMEYTIDIQLTELGFPDILQPQEAESTCHTTLSDDDSLSSHSSTSLSKTTQQKRVLRSRQSAAGKEAKSQPTLKAVSPVSGVLDPGHDLGHTEADRGSVSPALSEPTVSESTLLGNDQEEDGEKNGSDTAPDISMEEQQDEDDDSGDSEVSEVYDEEEIDDEEEEEEEQNSETGEHPCSICDLVLSSKFKLQDHMNLHTGARPYCCAECGKRFCQIYNYRVHLRTHAKAKVELLSCRICLKVFTSQKSLKFHLTRNHFEDKFYECDLCKRVFTTLKACEHHVELHKCMMSIVCEKCGRTFTTQKALRRHRSGTRCHSSFKCTDCPKTFTKKNALLKHSFSHLGLLPYTCIRCRCHFRLAKLYRQHKCKPERIHCVACLREFLSQEDFQQHKKDTGCWGNQEPKGDEIRCLECGQGFETPEELKQHAGAHQRVLKCAECGKGFRSALLLMSHMGGHAGQSPCLCQICGLGFPHQQNYDSHLKTCGKTPQPVKRQASKSSSSDTKKTSSSGVKKSSSSDAKQHAKKTDVSMRNTTQTNTSNQANAVTTSAVVNYPTAPAQDSWSPDQVTGGVSAVNSSSDRSWKLTLDKQPPPGIKLVLFLPVCSTQTNGLAIPTAVTQTLQAQPSPVSSHGHLGGALLNAPMDLVAGIKQDVESEEPLDLSKKCTSSESAVNDAILRNIKCEPEENEVSGETERQNIKSNTKAKHFVTLKDLSSHGVGASHGLIKEIKKEPQSPSSDLQPSTSCQLTNRKPDKEIKMEVDVSHPTCPDTD
ncbi:zinc finger protein 675-like [Sphaeramia orbicularis]|uniref:Zinc finger protein 675-like n=1 Tax=Sphaeramia orbicularis TaxID=375764 RepID=A0A673AUS8_9TELE|nr:zinc finger protein 675-like [Sphaeramia orbicularis]XP_030014582.1 zinc finger protein 675-like [Sphaeramia orbicularis]